MKVADAGSATRGFLHTPPASGNHYLYDSNGNLTTDHHKKATFAYNHFSLPRSIVFTTTTPNPKIEWLYDAAGMKLTKKLYSGTTLTSSKNYINGIEYSGANLEAIYHADGRLLPNGAAWHYDYTLKDHLGNARVTFRASGSIWANVEEMHYYPFGMQMENAGTANPTNKYLYNGKERNEDFGLNLSDYGARWYDAAVGRWWVIDNLADEPEQIGFSPYNYTWNSPVNLTDPDGNCPNCPTAVIGGVVGVAAGGLIEIGTQLWKNGKVDDWGAVKGAAAQGGITGLAVGFTGGASLLTTLGVGGAANVAGGIANRNIQGKGTTATDVVVDAGVGVASGLAGAAANKIVKTAADNLSASAKGKLGEFVTEVKYGAKGYKSTGKAKVDTGGKTPTGRDAQAHYDHNMQNPFTGDQLTVESKFNNAGLTPNQKAAANNVTTPGGVIVDRTTSGQLGNAAQGAAAGAAAATGNSYVKKSN